MRGTKLSVSKAILREKIGQLVAQYCEDQHKSTRIQQIFDFLKPSSTGYLPTFRSKLVELGFGLQDILYDL